MKSIESYTPGYSANASSFMSRRSVQSHARFLVSFLEPGMQVLDCGCGPGTISVGIARIVQPGQLIGIDREESQLELARIHAAELGVQNAEFRQGSLYELPFASDHFNMVFAHAVFEHLKEPVRALREVLRVLKPGGVVALRSPDWGGFLIAPQSGALDEAIEYYKELQGRNGGDVYVGRKLKGLLLETGFKNLWAGASYECYDPLESITEYLALRIEQSAIRSDLIAKNEIQEKAKALKDLKDDPAGLFAQAWCEAIGRKPVHTAG